MSYFEFSDGVRVALSKDEEQFLDSFKTSVKLNDVEQKHIKVCLMALYPCR